MLSSVVAWKNDIIVALKIKLKGNLICVQNKRQQVWFIFFRGMNASCESYFLTDLFIVCISVSFRSFAWLNGTWPDWFCQAIQQMKTKHNNKKRKRTWQILMPEWKKDHHLRRSGTLRCRSNCWWFHNALMQLIKTDWPDNLQKSESGRWGKSFCDKCSKADRSHMQELLRGGNARRYFCLWPSGTAAHMRCHGLTVWQVAKKNQPSLTGPATWNMKSFVTPHARPCSLKQRQCCLFAHTQAGALTLPHTQAFTWRKKSQNQNIYKHGGK